MGQTSSVGVIERGGPALLPAIPAAGTGETAGHPEGTMGSMRAWILPAAGSPPLQTSVAVPAPAGEYLRVRVVCAAINPSDTKRTLFPAVLGCDGAGIVDAGSPAELLGQRVMFRVDCRGGLGSFGEYTLVHRASLIPLPPAVTFADAAGLPTAAVASYMALFTKLRVESDKTIYITAGAGGVGGFAVQMALLARLKVITSCSTYNIAHVESKAGGGSLTVVDYSSNHVGAEVMRLTNGQGVDYLLDTLDSATYGEDHLKLVKAGGHLCSLAGPLGGEVQREAFNRGVSIHYLSLDRMHTDPIAHDAVVAASHIVVQMVAAGILKSNLGEVCSFTKVGTALESAGKNHVRGKLIVTVMKREKTQPSAPPGESNPAQQSSTTPIPQLSAVYEDGPPPTLPSPAVTAPLRGPPLSSGRDGNCPPTLSALPPMMTAALPLPPMAPYVFRQV